MNFDYKNYLLIATVIIAAGAVGLASRLYFPSDNIIEQACERIIHAKTGWNIDLSPD